MKKSLKALLIAVACVLTLATVATVSLSVMTYMKVSAMETAPAEEETPPEGGEGEDNVVIGSAYVIRSTKAISNAYLSDDISALSDRDRETLEMAKQVLDEVITDGMSDYEKETAVFLWMNANINVDSEVTVLVRDDVTTDNPHGVLSSHSAVCVGYATTFRLLMEMLGIPCKVVHDVSNVHSWDLVQIDSHWYHVDLYSAHNSGAPLTYLNRPDVLQHTFGSEWDTSYFPAADSFDACYLYRQAVEAGDVYAIPAAIKKAIDEQSQIVSLLIPSGDEDIVAEYLLTDLEDRMMRSAEYQCYTLTHAVVGTEDGKLFVTIIIEDYSYDPGEDIGTLPDGAEQKVDQAIADAFGEMTILEEYYWDY